MGIPSLYAKPGYGYIDKFGRNPDVDTAAIEHVWSYGGQETFMTTAAELFASSSSASDTFDIQVDGLDANFNPQSVTITLTGTTAVTLGASLTWIRVDQIKNVSSSAAVGTIYIAESDTYTTPGVPDTASKVHGIISIDYEQSQKAIWTMPAEKRGWIKSVSASILASGAAVAGDFSLCIKENGKVSRIIRNWGLDTDGTGSFLWLPQGPSPGLTGIPPKADVFMRFDAESNNTSVIASFEIEYAQDFNDFIGVMKSGNTFKRHGIPQGS